MNNAYLGEFEEQGNYLNFASVGPASRSARAASARLLDQMAVGDRSVPDIIEPAYAAALSTIAAAFGVDARRATSVPSTGAGIMQVAFGLIGAGGNVVVPSHEFPANRYPWLRAEAAGGPEVRAVEIADGRVVPEALAPAIDGETRIVAVSLVDYMTGFRVDVDDIAEAAGDALVLIDGIQGFGAVRAGLGAADIFVAGGQKWLRAGLGAGVMVVSDRALERLAPTLTGWWGVEDNFGFETPLPHPPVDRADRFLESSPNLLGAVAVAAALRVVGIGGIDEIEAAVLERSGVVLDLVCEMGCEVIAPWRNDRERAGIVTFRIPAADSTKVVAALGDVGFIVSERNGWIRVSPHATTPLRSFEAFGEALRDHVRRA